MHQLNSRIKRLEKKLTKIECDLCGGKPLFQIGNNKRTVTLCEKCQGKVYSALHQSMTGEFIGNF